MSAKDKQKYEMSNMSGFAQKHKDMKKRLASITKFGEIVQDLTPGEGICNIQRDIEDTKITPLTIAGSASSESKIKPSIFAMLEELYYDIFHQASSVNPKSPQFITMSAVMREKIYKNDVHELYRIVTGREPPPDIETFTDVAKYVNDNEEIKKWCNQPQNRNLKIKVSDELRNDSGFAEYIQHIKETFAFTSKQRKAIVGLLDRVFVTMKKSEEELREMDENWYKTGAKRYEGFERDDEYSREFFKLNLKYDFFINPNLTDAELQSITNEARARIVRLYADSYKRFFKGFQILQKIQANSEIIKLQAQQELGMKGQEMTGEKPSDKKTELEGVKWDNVNLRDARVARDIIGQQLSRKSTSVSRMYNELSEKLMNKGSSDRGQTQNCLTLLNQMNRVVREHVTNPDNFDTEITQRLEYQLSQLNQVYETNIAKPREQQQQPQQPLQQQQQPFLQVV